MVRGDGGTGRGDIGAEEQSWRWTGPGEGQRALEWLKQLVTGGPAPLERRRGRRKRSQDKGRGKKWGGVTGAEEAGRG